MVEKDLGKLYERSISLPHIIEQRKTLIKRVGYGEVKEGSSMDTTLRVGNLRERIGVSVDRLTSQLTDINQQLEEGSKREAKAFHVSLKEMKEKMGKIAMFANEGHIAREIFSLHETQLREFEDRPNREPWLKKALEDLEGERQSKKGTASDSEGKEKTSRNDPRPKQFELPDGEKIGGKAGRILFLASLHSFANTISIKELSKDLYKSDDDIAISNTKQAIRYAKEVLQGSEYEIIEAETGLYLHKKGREETSLPAVSERNQANLPSVSVTITVDLIDKVIRRKPRELMPYDVMENQVTELRVLMVQFQTGQLRIPGPQDFLGLIDTDKKLELAKETLQGLLATTIAGDIDKIGRYGLQVKLAEQINQLAFMIGDAQSIDIINKALDTLPELQRRLLFMALSINMKEKLDHPDLDECSEKEMAYYLRHATWPRLKGYYVRELDDFDFEAKEEQIAKVEKILNAIDERSRQGEDFRVSEIIENIGESSYADQIFLRIMKIAEIGGFLDLAERFFQEHDGTRNLAFLCNRKILGGL